MCVNYFQIFLAIKINSNNNKYSVSERCFAEGYRFYYWPWYKNINQEEYQKLHLEHNIHDHGGYLVSELYVGLKHLSLKDEMLNNNIYKK